MSNNASNITQVYPLTDDVDPNGLHLAAKAIEVAAMLGDSVVDVKHCVDPTSGKVSNKTWGLAAAGLTCVLLSAISFGVSVNTAARNKGAEDYWTHVAKKPQAAFRAQQLSYGYDWAAFGGLALGGVALAGALARSRRERRSPFYKIGTAPDVTLAVTGTPTESFPLVAPKGDDFVLNFGAGVTGEMMVDGKSASLAELAATGAAQPSHVIPGAFEMPIPMNAKIKATVGQTSFLVSGVAKPREQAQPMFAAMQSKTMGYFAGSMAAHLGMVLLLSQVAYDDGAAAIDLGILEATAMKTSSTEKTEKTPEQEVKENGGGGEEAANATAMSLEEGAAGTDKVPQNQTGHIRIKNNNTEPQLSREQAIEQARIWGVMGSAYMQDGDYFSSLDATGNISSGFDGTNVYGPLFGADGEGYGHFGMGRSGWGKGGGCTIQPCGIIGTGDGYNKIGLGKYGDHGYAGPFGDGPGIKRRDPKVPFPRVGQPESSGGYDKAIIRRYIRRNIDKIAYCYEKQLLANPTLSGTVNVQFVIAANGTVKTSTGKGVDPEVANCVADVVSNIAFPAPTDGGVVQVNYPFTFRPTN